MRSYSAARWVAWRLLQDLPPRTTGSAGSAVAGCGPVRDDQPPRSSWLIARGSGASVALGAVLDSQTSRRPRAAGRAATTPARRSRAASGRSWSTRTGVASSWSPSLPTFRTGTARLWSCGCRALVPVHREGLRRLGYAGTACDRHAASPSRSSETRRPGRLCGPSAPMGGRGFFAWISRNRRLWKDPEATLASARAFLYAASVMLLTRRLARLS